MIEGIFYITGAGGEIKSGLGEFLVQLTPNFRGISINADFLSQEFGDQIRQVKSEVLNFSNKGYPVIAVSYGANLLLHALAGEDKLKTHLIMMSPVFGGFSNLGLAIKEGRLVKPSFLSICVGQEDTVCDLSSIKNLAQALNADKLSIFPNERHMISPDIIQNFITKALDLK